MFSKPRALGIASLLAGIALSAYAHGQEPPTPSRSSRKTIRGPLALASTWQRASWGIEAGAAMSSSGDVGFTGGLFASIGVADHLELFAEAGYRRAGGHTVVVPALVRVRRDSLRIGAGPAAVVALDPDADDDRFGVAAVLSAGWSIPPYPYHGLVLDFRYQHGLTSSSRVGLVMAGLSF